MLDLSVGELNSFLPTFFDPATILSQNLSHKTTRVVLVRHGRSTSNDRGQYQGCSDESVLTEKGQKTAYQTGIASNSIDLDVVYTSPLKRARETAREIINARSNFYANIPPLLVSDKLKEINLSAWQGLSYQYVRENYAREYLCWKNYPHQFKLLNPETKQESFPVIDLYLKAQQFWREILPKNQGKTILIVGHGGTNRALINTAIGIKSDNYHYLQQCNCGISILEFNKPESKQGQLKALNLTAHLGKNLPKLKEGKHGLRLLLVSANSSSQQLQQLAEFWQQESIDFILSDNWEASTIFAQCLFPNRSKILHLQVLDRDFMEVWQKQIKTGKIQINTEKIMTCLNPKQSLTTGLVVIDRTNLNKIWYQISGSYAQAFSQNCLTIIHYPDLNKHPIIQGTVSLSSELGSPASLGEERSAGEEGELENKVNRL